MSPEEIEKLNNKFSHIAMIKRINDLEECVREKDVKIRNLCIEVSGKRMDAINVADKKNKNEIIFDLIACLLMLAILLGASVGGNVLWCTLLGSSFYAGYLLASKKG